MALLGDPSSSLPPMWFADVDASSLMPFIFVVGEVRSSSCVGEQIRSNEVDVESKSVGSHCLVLGENEVYLLLASEGESLGMIYV